MIKRDELSSPNSCLNRARDDEYVFVLLGRDPATPETIRAWIRERIRLGKNTPCDAQIIQALFTANTLEEEHKQRQQRESQ